MALIFGAVAKVVLPIALKKIIERTTDRETADRIEAEATHDPVVRNELNSEAPYQSRVATASMTTVITSLGVVLTQVGSRDFPDYDWEILGPALVTLWAGGYGLYGRFRSGLRPLWSRKG